jgi:hypothetical protein
MNLSYSYFRESYNLSFYQMALMIMVLKLNFIELKTHLNMKNMINIIVQ